LHISRVVLPLRISEVLFDLFEQKRHQVADLYLIEGRTGKQPRPNPFFLERGWLVGVFFQVCKQLLHIFPVVKKWRSQPFSHLSPLLRGKLQKKAAEHTILHIFFR
jgi:hypothetical protein